MKTSHYILIATLSLMISCANKDKDAFDSSKNNVQARPTDDPSKHLSNPGLLTEVKPTVKAKYDIKVLTRSGTRLCAGQVLIIINSNMSLSIPESSLKCLTATIHLSKLLGSVNNGTGGAMSSDATNAADVSSDGRILRKKTVGTAQFMPARPLIIGPIVQDPSKFMGLFDNQTYQVQDNGASGTGNIALQVLAVNTTFKPETFTGTMVFDKVIHWQMLTSGFEGINRAQAFLFDKIEFYWNSNPIAIPRIILEADIEDLGSGGILSGDTESLKKIGGGLLGKLTIDISAITHEAM
jgi:hypothetical protein